MRELTIDEGFMDDWYVLHERPWRRINGADIEGTAAEWMAIAVAIELGKDAGFKRCAVFRLPDGNYGVSSPRNSINHSVITPNEAKALAVEIRRVLATTEPHHAD